MTFQTGQTKWDGENIEVQKVINKYNSTISIQISKFNKHSQYQLKRPYNAMQATRLLRHNNPPNTIIKSEHVSPF